MRRAPFRYLLPRLAPAILTLTLAHAALALADLPQKMGVPVDVELPVSEDQIRAGQQTTL